MNDLLAPNLAHTSSPVGRSRRLVLNTAESFYVIQTSDIIRCQATDNYTQFFLSDKRKLLVSKTLKDYEELLQPYGFMRLHHAHLINLHYLERYDKKEGGLVVMRDQSVLPVSVRKREKILDLLKTLL